MQVQEVLQDNQELQGMLVNKAHPVRTEAQVPMGDQDHQVRREREEHPESEAPMDPLEHPDSTVRSCYLLQYNLHNNLRLL